MPDYYILLGFDVGAGAIAAYHLALQERTNADGHLDPSFVRFVIRGNDGLFHSNFIIRTIPHTIPFTRP